MVAFSIVLIATCLELFLMLKCIRTSFCFPHATPHRSFHKVPIVVSSCGVVKHMRLNRQNCKSCTLVNCSQAYRSTTFYVCNSFKYWRSCENFRLMCWSLALQAYKSLKHKQQCSSFVVMMCFISPSSIGYYCLISASFMESFAVE